MKEFGTKICTIIEVNYITRVEIFMKENSLKIWRKVLGFISMPMEANILAIGIKINKMGLARNNGVMAASIKDIMKMHLRKVKANIFGLMEILTLENGKIICLMEKVFSFGMMIECFSEIGRIMSCMEKVLIGGEMEGCSWVHIRMIRNKVRASTCGQMDVHITATGKMVNKKA